MWSLLRWRRKRGALATVGYFPFQPDADIKALGKLALRVPVGFQLNEGQSDTGVSPLL